jgi:hypothetical protein
MDMVHSVGGAVCLKSYELSKRVNGNRVVGRLDGRLQVAISIKGKR